MFRRFSGIFVAVISTFWVGSAFAEGSFFKNLRQQVMSGITVTTGSAASEEAPATKKNQADPALQGMKYKVDIAGIRLGMAAAEAKKLAVAAIPGATVDEYMNTRTKKTAGWDFYINGCELYGSCVENSVIRVRVVKGKVWLVSRSTTYSGERGVPTTKSALEAINEKYGKLIGPVKDGSRTRGHDSDTMSISHSFNRNGTENIGDYYDFGCNGGAGRVDGFDPDHPLGPDRGDILADVFSTADWSYAIDFSGYKNGFSHSIYVQIADCQFMSDYLTVEAEAANKAAQDAFDKEAQKGVTPKL